MTEIDHESESSDTDLEEESESEADRLYKQLEAVRKQSEELNITANAAASNPNYKKLLAKGQPILSLDIPNSLLLLWSKRKKIESKLGVPETPLVKLATESIQGNFISLDATSTTLMERLRTKQVRFMVNYRKNGGAKKRKLQKLSTNMILLREEVISSSSNTENQHGPQVYMQLLFLHS